MEPAEAPSLMLQAEKALQQPIKPHLFSHCPTMDLVAVVGQDDNLDVYRLNGQRAFGLKRRMGSAVESICWKFNGTSLDPDLKQHSRNHVTWVGPTMLTFFFFQASTLLLRGMMEPLISSLPKQARP